MLAFLTGCDGNPSPFSTKPAAPPFSTGSDITNLDGSATGTVWGVSLQIEETTGGVSISVDSTASAVSGTTAKGTFKIGKDTLEFTKDATSPIYLRVNGKDYGTIAVGDSLVIHADRSVTINGEAREPN